MKKVIVFLCFGTAAACLLTAAFQINKTKTGMDKYVVTTNTVRNPELLSEINISSYVSLPASFEAVSIEEQADDMEINEENVDAIIFEQLLARAAKSEQVKNDELLIVNYSVTSDNELVERETDYKLGYGYNSEEMDSDVYNSLKEASIGVPLHLEDVDFAGYEDVTLDIEIKDIYDMPYPVTDNYVKNNTEYSSLSDMRTRMLQDASDTATSLARNETIGSLISRMMKQTTFLSAPDSLVLKELEVLQKEDERATYEDAQDSLDKIMFIAAVLSKYDIADQADIQERFDSLPEDDRNEMSEYEAERQKYLLFEDDVTNYIYKKIKIQ